MSSKNDNEQKVYRYKFSEQFRESLVQFAKIHKFDDVQTFKNKWDE